MSSISDSSVSGMRSLPNPGSAPLLKNDVLAGSARSSNGSRSSAGRRLRVHQLVERRRHHVATGAEEPAHLLDRSGGARADAVAQVAEAVGVDRQQLVDVARRDHAGRVQPDELARVAADLVRVVHVQADQLEVGVLQHARGAPAARCSRCPSARRGGSCRHPQVGAREAFLVELVARPHPHEPAQFHERHRVRHLQHLVRLLLHQEDRRSRGPAAGGSRP